ncbi:MAG: hypothetical protein AB7T38_02650 [Nitrospirales bacterium]
MKKPKPPLTHEKQFGSLEECRKFLRLPEKKIRALRRLGAIRLDGGRTTPEDLSADWKAHAHLLGGARRPLSGMEIGANRYAGVTYKTYGAELGRPLGTGKDRIRIVTPIVADHATWAAGQGSAR